MNSVSVQNKKRDSNFELLRIIAMLLIIFSHQNQHGILFPLNHGITFNFLFCKSVFSYMGAIGNWLFILISGYFISETSFSWRKVFRLWFQVFSISVIIGLFAWFSKVKLVPHWDWRLIEVYNFEGFFAAARQMNVKDLIRSLFPTYFAYNWFASSYIVFFILSPFLSLFLSRINQEEHKNLIIVLTVFVTVIPLLPFEAFYIPSTIFPFILGFFIAKYIKMYSPKFFENKNGNLMLSLCIFAFLVLYTILAILFFSRISFGKRFHDTFIYRFGGNNSVLIMMLAVFLFCFFRKLSFSYNRLVNTVASTTFGVYLIHENFLVNKWWWHKICRLDDFINSPLLIPYMCLCTLVTFMVCSALEFVRKNTLGRVLR